MACVHHRKGRHLCQTTVDGCRVILKFGSLEQGLRRFLTTGPMSRYAVIAGFRLAYDKMVIAGWQALIRRLKSNCCPAERLLNHEGTYER